MLLKGISRSKYLKNAFNKIQFKTAFLVPEKPWSSNANTEDLPLKGQDVDSRLESSKTYTKWFNPNTFDPRTPDYFETVRSEWQEDVTHEDIGECKIKFSFYFNWKIK